MQTGKKLNPMENTHWDKQINQAKAACHKSTIHCQSMLSRLSRIALDRNESSSQERTNLKDTLPDALIEAGLQSAFVQDFQNNKRRQAVEHAA